MTIRVTKKQARLLYVLLDTYVESCVENDVNRNDLRMAKRLRWKVREFGVPE